MSFHRQEAPLLVSLQKIWSNNSHSAFSDLIRFRDIWYCIFRESDTHVKGKNGIIRLLASRDSVAWETIHLFEEEGVDLRDPKLSITPTGQLMVLIGGTIYDRNGSYVTRQSRVSFSNDARNWTSLEKVLVPHEWLWRVTWHKGKAYGFSYRFSDPSDRYKEFILSLHESIDGVHYEQIKEFDIRGYPNETTLRFLPSGEMIALLRRDRKFDYHAWIGVSRSPFTDWKWVPTAHYFGGPNFLILEDGKMWAAGRLLFMTPYGEMERTALAKMTKNELTPVLILPSGGDSSYPGLVYHDGYLWMSYYSMHENCAAIYLAKILLP